MNNIVQNNPSQEANFVIKINGILRHIEFNWRMWWMGRGRSQCQVSFRLSVDGVDWGGERDIQVINKYNNINNVELQLFMINSPSRDHVGMVDGSMPMTVFQWD